MRARGPAAAPCASVVSGTARSTSTAMRPEPSAAAIHRLCQLPNHGPVSMASAMPVGMKQLHSAVARLRLEGAGHHLHAWLREHPQESAHVARRVLATLGGTSGPARG